jgi:hypothetical protein
MAVYSVFRSGVLTFAAAALLPAWAQQSTTQIVSGPTRMQRCQAELADVKGSARTLKLRKCLIDRTEGERLLTRECNQKYRALPTGHKEDKVSFQKQCVATGLKVGHEALPRRKAPAPVAQASGAKASAVVSQPAASKAQATPAAKAASKPAEKPADKPAAKPAPAAKPSAMSVANPGAN